MLQMRTVQRAAAPAEVRPTLDSFMGRERRQWNCVYAIRGPLSVCECVCVYVGLTYNWFYWRVFMFRSVDRGCGGRRRRRRRCRLVVCLDLVQCTARHCLRDNGKHLHTRN